MSLAPAMPASGNWLRSVTARSQRRLLLLLNGFEIIDNRAHLLGREHEFRHIRVTGRKALSQRLAQAFDLVSAGQRSERRRLRMRTGAGAADRMAASTIRRQQRLAAHCRGPALLC